MKVGINGTPLQTLEPTGVEAYALELVRHLIARLPPEALALFFSSRANLPALPGLDRLQHGFRFDADRLRTRWLWEQLILPRELARLGIDLFHGLAGTLPVRFRGRMIVTVHDVAFLRLPDCYHLSTRLYWKLLLGPSIRRARHVLTGSNATRDDLVTRLGVPAERVTVTPYGVSPFFEPRDADEAWQRSTRRYPGLRRPFLLFVSALSPRKNHRRLFEALRHLDRDDVQLVCVGKRLWDAAPIEAAAADLVAPGRVLFLGYLDSRDALVDLYAAATGAIYPPLFEGFGLPLLEAMACGCPVIASDIPSTREILLSDEPLFDPSSATDASRVIARLLDDSPWRSTLARRGRERAASFSWEQMADRTLQLYRAVSQ